MAVMSLWMLPMQAGAGPGHTSPLEIEGWLWYEHNASIKSGEREAPDGPAPLFFDISGCVWNDFKAKRSGLGAYCKQRGYDDLGFTRTMKKFFADEWEHVIEAKVPKTTMYKRGRVFEYRVRDYLKGLGYFVMRSPASRSPVDLVAIAQGQILFVQCKLSDQLCPAEWNELFDLAESTGAIPVLATRSAPRRLDIWRLMARKETDGSKNRQPREMFDPAVMEVSQ